MSDGLNPWSESAGMHRQYPYRELVGRYKNDGAPEGDGKNLFGFAGPLRLENGQCAYGFHAYRVINPPVDQTTTDVTVEIPRAPSRLLRFVGPDGNAMRGVMVDGLVSSEHHIQVVLDGSEAEAIALEADNPRQILAISSDGKYIVRDRVLINDPEPKTIRLEPSATVSGRLLDDATGQPRANYNIWVSYPKNDRVQMHYNLTRNIKTDAQGRFEIVGLFPELPALVSFQEPAQGFMKTPKLFSPETTKNVILTSGESRDLGEIRVRQDQARKQ
jgi:hypothetical protein